MKNALFALAIAAGVGIALLSPVSGQDGAAAKDGKGKGGRGGGKGAPAEPAGPMPRLPDGHPDMQGFWNPPAITDIEPAPPRAGGAKGGRGGGAPGGAPAAGGPGAGP